MRTLLTALCALPLILSLPASAWAQSSDDGTAEAQPSAIPIAVPIDPAAQDAAIAYGGPEPVVVVSGDLRHEFTAQLATTPAQMERGLMWREDLAPDAGMLFHYNPPRRTSIWMVNTLTPLDILYIREDGRIAKIVAFAQPGSRRGLPSDAVVAGVLEIPAGRALELGIAPGDRIEHRFFSPPALPVEADEDTPDAPPDATPDETLEDADAAAEASEDTE